MCVCESEWSTEIKKALFYVPPDPPNPFKQSLRFRIKSTISSHSGEISRVYVKVREKIAELHLHAYFCPELILHQLLFESASSYPDDAQVIHGQESREQSWSCSLSERASNTRQSGIPLISCMYKAVDSTFLYGCYAAQWQSISSRLKKMQWPYMSQRKHVFMPLPTN